jgi:L-ribulose-5-phosphate 3-epimerase
MNFEEKIGFMQGRLSPMQNGTIQCFPWSNWEKEFEISSQNGFNIMEWTIDRKEIYKNPLMNVQGRQKILHLCRNYGINVNSITLDACMQAPFWKCDSKLIQHRELEVFEDICKASAEIGIKILVLPVVDNGAFDNNDQKDILVNELISRLKFLKTLGIKIAFELDLEPTEVKGFINQFPNDTFGINYDSGNSAANGFNIITEFEQYSENIINVHIKDRKYQGNTIRLGCGDVVFKDLFKELIRIKFQGNLILQTARSPDNFDLQELLTNKKYLQNYGQNLL